MNQLILPLFLIVISSLLYSQFLSPQFSILEKRNGEIDRLQSALNNAKDIQTLRDELLNEFNLIPDQQRRTLQQAVPLDGGVARAKFFVDLESLLRSSGVIDTARIVESESVDSTEFVNIPIAIFLDSISYNTAEQFVDRIQNWSRGVKISSVSIEIASDELASDSIVFINLTVRLEVPFSKRLNT